MTAEVISGKDMAASIREEVKERIASLKESGLIPGLAVVLVGEDPASQAYVAMKNKDATEVGIHSLQITLPEETSEEELLGVVAGLNADPEIHGVLVQLPLPDQIDESKILLAVDPSKDVDGFHPVNVGRLASGDPDVLVPCTPAGVVQMLLRSGHDPGGKHVVVVWALEHRRPADGSAPVAQGAGRKRHRDRGAQPHARPRFSDARGGHSDCSHRAARFSSGGYGETRRRGHRRGHYPGAR